MTVQDQPLTAATMHLNHGVKVWVRRQTALGGGQLTLHSIGMACSHHPAGLGHSSN